LNSPYFFTLKFLKRLFLIKLNWNNFVLSSRSCSLLTLDCKILKSVSERFSVAPVISWAYASFSACASRYSRLYCCSSHRYSASSRLRFSTSLMICMQVPTSWVTIRSTLAQNTILWNVELTLICFIGTCCTSGSALGFTFSGSGVAVSLWWVVCIFVSSPFTFLDFILNHSKPYSRRSCFCFLLFSTSDLPFAWVTILFFSVLSSPWAKKS
jgi:hypothetical protein